MSGGTKMRRTEATGPITLTVTGSIGHISPSTVIIDTHAGPCELVVANRSRAEATVVLPNGLGLSAHIVVVPAEDMVTIPINPSAPRNAHIPFWVFFHDNDRVEVHDWGVAASPPTMIIKP